MKKRILLILLTVAFALSATACTVKANSTPLCSYNITATLADNSVNGHLSYTLYNRGDSTLTEQIFMLYGKAYQKNAKHPAVVNDKAYYAGKSYGDQTVTNVTVGGTAVTPEFSGDDGEFMRVSFSDLYPQEKVVIEMDFSVQLAKINHRLGVTAHAVNLGGFYPTAVPYDNGSALAYPYYSIGDPFCTDVADFAVELTVPTDMVLAASSAGTRSGETYSFTAKNVRDFAAVGSREFKVATANVGDTVVNYYYYKDTKPEDSLKIATQALTYFNQQIGAYPYPSYAVCETGFVHAGMEYPSLVMISDAVGDGQAETIVHETAHQWWYGVVGNDEVKHAWQDEGLTDYMTTLFYDATPEYGQTRTDRMMKTTAAYLTYVDVYSSLTGKVDTTMDRALDKFTNEQEYTYMTYYKGELMFDTLRDAMGSEKFTKALQAYYKAFKFDRATPDEMIAAFNKSCGRDLTSMFRAWLDGKVVLA